MAKVNIVTLMVLFSIMSYFDRTIMAVAGPGIIRDFDLTETQLGAVYSAFLLGYALMMIPGGHLTDRLGPWRALIGMGFGAALLTGLTALGARPSLGSLLGIVSSLVLIRFMVGVCTAPLYPACGRMIANWFPSTRQGLVWGLVAGGAGIGSALSPSLFAWMIPRFGWRDSFWLAGAATALLATLWAWYARDGPSEHRSARNADRSAPISLKPQGVHTSRQSGLRKLLTNRNVVLLAVGYGTVSYFEYIFFYWIYYYFREIRRMSQSETSTYTTVIFLAWVVMSPLGGWLSDRSIRIFGKRIGRPIVPTSCILVSAILLFLGTHVLRPWLVGALLALSFGLASASDGPFWAAAIAAGGENAGAAGGVLNTGSNIGGFIAPVLTPFIASFVGWSSALHFGCLVATLGVGIWFFMDVTPSSADFSRETQVNID
ncbi:MAG: MFS transporter [Terriglobales bacterium]